MTENIYQGIKETMQITTEDVTRCEPCNYLPKDFADTINHYLSHHGYKLLHIGSQSSPHGNGNDVTDIIALLGK